jgi:pterin-4a-carbinolamine dehydratase
MSAFKLRFFISSFSSSGASCFLNRIHQALSSNFRLHLSASMGRQISTSNEPLPNYSTTTDKAVVDERLGKLLEFPSQWTLTASGSGVQRRFRFKTFNQTSVRSHLAFFFIGSSGLSLQSCVPVGMSSSSLLTCSHSFVIPDGQEFIHGLLDLSSVHNHHPSFANTYNSVLVRWTTHRPPGLSLKDVELAGLCDSIAERLGTKVKATEPRRDGDRDKAQQADELEELVNAVEFGGKK